MNHYPLQTELSDAGSSPGLSLRTRSRVQDRKLELPEHPLDTDNTETSDFDSISTTSASYVVTTSDIESLSIDDNQLDILMNKSDLSDFDQLDTKTITGSGDSSSDESLMDRSGSRRQHLGDLDQATGGDPAAGSVSDQAMCEGQDPSGLGQVSGTRGPAQHRPGHAGPGSVTREPRPSEEQRGDKRAERDNNVSSNTTSGNSPLSLGSGDSQSDSGSVARVSPSEPRDSPGPEGKQITQQPGTQLSFASIDSDRVGPLPGQERLTKRKGSVSDLIARFESNSRSTTPERSLTPLSHSALSKQSSLDIQENISSETEAKVKDTGARPKVPQASSKNKSDKKHSDAVSNTNEANESLISNESVRAAELKGLKEFTQKYLKEQQARNATGLQRPSDGSQDPGDLVEDNLDSDILEDIDPDNPDMPPTIRRNSGGAYTSYVFISSDPSNDDVASVHSSNGSYTDPEGRVTVNVKESQTCVSPNTCVVSIQDGRTSNISIVSTESSELNSPRGSPTELEDGPGLPPELPTKVRVGGAKGAVNSELQQIVYATRESLRDFSHRSRGGEADFERDFNEEELGQERSGHE